MMKINEYSLINLKIMIILFIKYIKTLYQQSMANMTNHIPSTTATFIILFSIPYIRDLSKKVAKIFKKYNLSNSHKNSNPLKKTLF
uniref:Uncharacterized protein n=1 Tax=Panstrongylus lignarius TaxID=156445 RepID=A0A224Y2S7_9HEMI